MENKIGFVLFTLLAYSHTADCTENVVSPFVCDPGWELVSPDAKTCVLLSDDQYGFQGAVRACEDLGAKLITLWDQNLENFIYGKADVSHYWIALKKPSGYYRNFLWLYNDQEDQQRTVERNRFIDSFSYSEVYRLSAESCGYLVVPDQGWSGASHCGDRMNYICTKPSRCPGGYFGRSCEKECHCQGQVCDEDGRCEYDCQKGWTGRGCATKIEPAEVVYYCFNTTLNGARVLLQVDTKRISYSVLHELNAEQAPVGGCDTSNFKFNYVFTTELPGFPSRPDLPLCGGHKTGPTTWEWQLALRQMEGVQSRHDVIFKVTCDFSRADGLAISSDDNIKVSGKITSDVKEIKVKKEEVSFTLVDPVTKAELKQAEIGTFVELRFQLNKHGGLSAEGVSPFNCLVYSSDGKFTKQLSDTRGCSAHSHPYLFGNATVQTELFPLFAFPGSAVINFRCEYEFCLQYEMRCTNRCQFFVKNGEGVKRKRSSTTAKKPVYTSIKVLTPKEELAVDAPPEKPDKLRGVPLLYLNPITCSMFLFLLSVFLLYYVFFIKSLKKAVDEMKQELKLQNRWQRL